MINLGRNDVRIDQEPDSCPVCNHLVSANRSNIFKEIYDDSLDYSRYLEVLYECPSTKCGHLFLAHFERKSESQNSINAHFSYSHSTPNHFKPPKFDERVYKVSSSFVEIFNQSANAEANGLSEVCGMGYRKALEFLIKDYCIASHTNETETIKAMPLMQCINKYISDINIKECATRAVWLGNDETHYQRKWQDNDIYDLKLLIGLVVHWVVSSLMTQEYMQSMTRK
ncbi:MULTISPECIES: DUF4145 domain-containing protein [Vibrio]|uniref:DUF4145 domain-containing protein n=1 Tax=Vibrio TaxID=662 RepID=UPI0011239F09|nr:MULTISPECIES: DUF4145 domain-containing protein [Vibrio]MDW1729970.1 DUF4145 domain-containing protein [Vibrio sp. Vb2356]TOM30276.1 hypothetical protein CGH78_23790 [Vibrio parahaemolyticus]